MNSERVFKPIARREFLRISSAAVAGIAASGLLNPGALLADTGDAFQPLLSIGFTPSLPGRGQSVRLASAASILTPDPAFISRGAHIQVVGGARSAGRKNTAGTLSVDALFPSKSGAKEENRRFQFWSVKGDEVEDRYSGPIEFNLPVLATTGASFMARYERPLLTSRKQTNTAPAVDRDNAPFVFALGAPNGPKLQRGVYILALRESSTETQTSDWDRLSLVNTNGVLTVSGASFGYVILSVDYPSGAASRR